MKSDHIHNAPSRRSFLKAVLSGFAVVPGLPLAAQELKIQQSLKGIAGAAGLSGIKSIVVMDATTGAVLDSFNGAASLPPASITKTATALYAIDRLGPQATFKTRILATGPIKNGVLKGDLVLQGSGDPGLDTDALGSLAEQLKARGVKVVRGKFYVYAGALPYQRQIDPEQPDYAGYNATIHGINLNFNRVLFKWQRGAEGYILSMVARGKKYAPEVKGIKIAVKIRKKPVFSYRSVSGSDRWTVARSALGKGGSRWLPVRNPADYAGEVFRSLAALNGIRMPRHKVTEKPIVGKSVAVWQSGRILALAKSMIKYSTNMTAETLGMSASVTDGLKAGNLGSSSQAMTRWLESKYGVRGARFVDHSGLGVDSRISADVMARLLVKVRWDGPLRPLMKEITLRDANWKKAPIKGAKVVVKTGTLDFTSALAGYISCPNGRKLAFAIFTTDMKKRAAIPKKDRDNPPGAKLWARKSRVMQHQLVRYWVGKYGT
jgi:serine-type D-Ala-D-Ala carboxypeptidase/endopeptidase (penicillin-binding protein 4)